MIILSLILSIITLLCLSPLAIMTYLTFKNNRLELDEIKLLVEDQRQVILDAHRQIADLKSAPITFDSRILALERKLASLQLGR